MKEVFARIPESWRVPCKGRFGRKAGPFTYGRTQADGANMLADIVKEYGAIIIWRCFVYNCTQDWRDYKTDRRVPDTTISSRWMVTITRM